MPLARQAINPYAFALTVWPQETITRAMLQHNTSANGGRASSKAHWAHAALVSMHALCCGLLRYACLRLCRIGKAQDVKRVSSGRGDKVKEIGPLVRHHRHVGAGAGAQRLHEEQVCTLVGRDLPGSGIADGDVFNVLIILKGDGGTWRVNTDYIKRKDVSDYFKNPLLDYSGFTATIPKDQLPAGTYTVGIEQVYGKGQRRSIRFSDQKITVN